MINTQITTPNYQCPICASSLTLTDKSLRCEQNHSFDYAKEGYVHLLPVQLKKSLNPGDNKEMVLARRAFLQLGHYQFLRDALTNLITKASPTNVLDLGCGEGYYTDYVQQNLPNAIVYGVDISKDAVKYAAKRNKQVHYSVATNAHTPFPAHSIDIIMNVFAPLVGSECQRILSENSRIISVAPGAYHLKELKHAIYDSPELHSLANAPDNFYLVEEQQIDKVIYLNTEDEIENLLTMTPFGWKITSNKKRELLSNLPFKLTLHFTINEFKLK